MNVSGMSTLFPHASIYVTYACRVQLGIFMKKCLQKKISRHDEIIYIYRRMSTHHMDLEVPYHEPESKCFLIGQIIRHKFDMYLLITLTSVLTKSRNILRLISKKPRPKTVRIQECNNF